MKNKNILIGALSVLVVALVVQVSVVNSRLQQTRVAASHDLELLSRFYQKKTISDADKQYILSQKKAAVGTKIVKPNISSAYVPGCYEIWSAMCEASFYIYNQEWRKSVGQNDAGNYSSLYYEYYNFYQDNCS